MTTKTETVDILGHHWPIGYYGYDAWWYGTADAATEILASLADDIERAPGKTWPKTKTARRVNVLRNRLDHFLAKLNVEGHGIVPFGDAPRCAICEWWPEDVDAALDLLNDLTPEGYVWHLWEGGVFLSVSCGGNDCGRDDCAACNY